MIPQVITQSTPDIKFVAGYENGTKFCLPRNTPSQALRAWSDHIFIWLRVYQDRKPNSAFRREAVGYTYADNPISLEVLAEQLGVSVDVAKEILEAEKIEVFDND